MKTPESDAGYELKSKILKAAFKQEKFEYPQSSEIIEVPAKLYIYSSNGKKRAIPIGCRKNMKFKPTEGVIKGLSTDTLVVLRDILSKIDSFTYDLSEIIWHCMEERSPEWAKELLAEIEQSYMADMKHFSIKQEHNKATRDKCLREQRKHAKRQVATIGKTVEFNYKQGSHGWIEEENIAINKAYLLYKENWNGKKPERFNVKLPELSDRQIITSLAIVFAATDFWIDKQNDVDRQKIYIERIKNRLRSIKKEIQEDRDAHEDCLYDDFPQKNIQKD